jgi:hypothetical protein
MADTETRTNTEKWPLKCTVCKTKIMPGKKYVSIQDDMYISCGSENCTIMLQDEADNDGA